MAPSESIPDQGNIASYLDDFVDTNYPNWYTVTQTGTVSGPTLLAGRTINTLAISANSAYFALNQIGPTQVVKGMQARMVARLSHNAETNEKFIVGMFPPGTTNPLGTAPANGFWFECNSGTWTCVSASNGTGGSVQSVTPAYPGVSSGYDDYEVHIDGPGITGGQCMAHFFINGLCVAEIPNACPAGSLLCGFGATTGSSGFTIAIDRIGRTVQGQTAANY